MNGRFSKTLALFLPGIFLLGFNIGTGSVTAMAKAGATYGMSLLWTIVASCLATFFMINVYGRLTLVTGETALQAFRQHIHPLVGLFFIVALTAGVSGSVMGVMGIVAEISSEWSKALVDGGIAPVWFAAFFVSLVYFIFWLVHHPHHIGERSGLDDCRQQEAAQRSDLMGEHRNSVTANVLLTAILVFSIVTTSMGIRGVWQLITT
jgi:Mn2+/Fe2+ NRAMP family transporter